MADLTTLAIVKTYMQITDTVQDASLSRLITAFSAWFLNQCNRGALLSATYTESRNGTGSDALTTKYFPITAVSSVIVNGVSVPASPDGVQPGYVFDGFSIFIISGGSSIGYGSNGGVPSAVDSFCRGRQNVKITYTAGYPTTPADVEQAVIDQVVFTHRRQRNLGTVAQTMSGQLTTSFSQRDLAPGVQAVIDNYKTRTAVGI